MALSYRQLLVAVPLVIHGGNVPNIVGEAGIGKSALVQEVASREHAQLFTTVVSLVEKGDLSIPVPPLTSDSFVQTKYYGKLADVQFGYAHTLIEIIKSAEAHPMQPIYWFLDEFNRGSQAVQSELMNLVLQRQVNGLKLPRQVHMIIAENPDASMTGFEHTDYGVVSGDAAIKDRTVRLVMKSSFKDWLKWAQSSDRQRHRQMIKPSVIKFLKLHPDLLNAPQLSQDLYPTPRAWKRASDNLYELNRISSDYRRSLMLDILAGDLGVDTATALKQFLLNRTVQISAHDFESQSISELEPKFNQMDEAQKQQTLLRGFKTQSISSSIANKFLILLKQLSVDGQYSLALTLSRQKFFDRLYRKIKSTHDSALIKLYVQFEKIGLTGY